MTSLEALRRVAAEVARLQEERQRLAVEAVEGGASEVEASAAAGVSRMTLRKWLGK